MQPEIVTDYIRPPIPSRAFDWQATIKGADEGGPVGYGATEAGAIADLREQLAELED